jgi:hypothetical protein
MVSIFERCAGLYPPLPPDFDRGDFIPLIPVIVIVLIIALLIAILASYFTKTKHSFLDMVLLYYFSISFLIHTNLERYYTHHLDDILYRNSSTYNHPITKI